MSENGHNHHRQEREEHNKKHHDHRPYWKRAHRDWRVWVAVFLMLVGMIVYLMTNDLAWGPSSQPPPPVSGDVGE